jgi:hypothetical protein
MNFRVVCCGRRRGVLPGGVLVCNRCDISVADGTGLPNENKVRDVPAGQKWWRVPRV